MRQVYRPRYRGVTSILAMIYLVLFASLAIGFYAATTTAVQVAGNDRRAAIALAAASSGMDFMRHELSRVSIPPGTTLDNTRSVLFQQLKDYIGGTQNVKRRDLTSSGNTILIPSDPSQFIPLESTETQAFRVAITEWAGDIVVKVTGRYATPQMIAAGTPVLRTITMDFTRETRAATAFNYAVASRGKVSISNGNIRSLVVDNPTMATVMSATSDKPSILMVGGSVGGDLNIVMDGRADIFGGSVSGTSIVNLIYQNHVKTVPAPEFPITDTAYYRQYATNNYIANAKVQQNIRIPANTNPRFAGGDEVQGLMYIESPNTVEFRGNFNLKGFIVFENTNSSGVNVMDFSGSVVQSPLPSGPQFDGLRATSGISMLAPTTYVKMTGSNDSSLIGNVMVGKFRSDGAADVTIRNGSLMAFDSNPNANAVEFTTSKNLSFTGIGANNLPTTGLNLAAYYAPKPSSYQELLP